MTAPLLEFLGIEKSFFGVKVLREISFSVHAGGTVGLVGENGAGKSTLMNILGGNVAPDAGTMTIDGASYKPSTPRDAEARGIAFIHQELNLFPNLTLAENLLLTRLPRTNRLPFIARAKLQEQAGALLRDVGLEQPPDSLVETLSTGERQLVEIAKALAIDARLIIFDEPTTSLTARETERLFALIAQLRKRGIAIIYISHSLSHVRQICENLVILRDGAVVGHGKVEQFDENKLISLMVGREIKQLFPKRKIGALGPAVLEARDISDSHKVRGVSFALRGGEIVGLSGLMGAGRSETARCIFGLERDSTGGLLLDGQPVRCMGPCEAIAQGLAFLTENRASEGLCLDASVAHNLTLPILSTHSRGPFRLLKFSMLDASVKFIRTLVKIDLKVSNEQPVRTLSGGNQQKIVLGKWLLNNPRVLILDEPTRGIDVGSKAEIYQLITARADQGAAVLIISSEIEELIGLCDRILVLRRGEVAAEFAASQFDREEILRASVDTGPAKP